MSCFIVFVKCLTQCDGVSIVRLVRRMEYGPNKKAMCEIFVTDASYFKLCKTFSTLYQEDMVEIVLRAFGVA